MVNRTPITVHGNPAHPRFTEATNLALGPLPGDCRVAVSLQPRAVYVCSEIWCADRATGADAWIAFRRSFDGVDAHMPIIAMVRETVLRAYEHEVAECLYSRGVRVFDPHAGEEVAVSCG